MSAASRLLSPLLERSGNYNLSSPSISVSSSASSASMTAESPPPLTFPINPGLFFDAVYNNDIATLRRLHQADPELSKARAGSGMTPLLFAVDQNCADVVRFLLEEAKVDVNDCDAKGVNSLIIAVENGNEFLVNYLLQMGANPNKRDCDEASPLLIAAELRRTKIVRLLVRARADCNTADNLGQTPLLASVYTRNLKAVRVLLEEGNADVDQAMKGGYSPLHLACKMGHLPIVSYLLQEHRKANVNLSDDDGLGPLHVAVINNQREIVQFLLGYSDANVDLRDERGFTPIHHAAVKGNLEMVKLLVVEGHADVDICSYEGVSVLDCASIRGSQEVYDYLAPLMTSPPHEADASGPAMVEFLQFLHMCAESEQQHNVHSYSIEANEPAPAAGEGGGLAVTVPADSPAEEEDDVVPLPGAGFGAGPRSPSNLAAPRRSIDENDDGHSITVTRSNLGSIQDVSRSRSDRKLLYPKPRFQKKT